MEKVSKGKGSYQPSAVRLKIQVSELLGESYEERVSSCRRRFNAEKRVIRYQSSEVRLKILVSELLGERVKEL